MTTFLSIGKVEHINPGSKKVVIINDHEILIANVDGTYYAFDNVCTCITEFVGHKRNGDASDPHTHGGRLARLQYGDIEEAHVRCPTHGSVYDLRTGHPLSGSAEIALNTYEVWSMVTTSRLPRWQIAIGISGMTPGTN